MGGLGECFITQCDRLQGIPVVVLCLSIFVLQSAIIDYYLIEHLSSVHFTWIAADAIGFTLLFLAIYTARTARQSQKSFSMAWATWFVLGLIVAAKIIVIFVEFANDLEEEDPSFFGPNTLKTGIALGSIIFLTLLLTQHEAPLGSERRKYIEEITGTVSFDLLDTADILEVLFDETKADDVWGGLGESILFVATVNLLLPTVPLFTLSKTQFGKQKLPTRMVYLHRLLLVLAVNVPNLVIRMVLWHGLSVGISPFCLKNIILICMTFFEFYEHKKEVIEEKESEELPMEGNLSKLGNNNMFGAEENNRNGLGDSRSDVGNNSNRSSKVEESFALESRIY